MTLQFLSRLRSSGNSQLKLLASIQPIPRISITSFHSSTHLQKSSASPTAAIPKPSFISSTSKDAGSKPKAESLPTKSKPNYSTKSSAIECTTATVAIEPPPPIASPPPSPAFTSSPPIDQSKKVPSSPPPLHALNSPVELIRRAMLSPLPTVLPSLDNDSLADQVFGTNLASNSDEFKSAYHIEKLEFLGDRLLASCVAEICFVICPQTGSDCTWLQNKFIKSTMNSFLTELAQRFEMPGGGYSKGFRDKNSADRFEAYLAALFLSKGRARLHRFLAPLIYEQIMLPKLDVLPSCSPRVPRESVENIKQIVIPIPEGKASEAIASSPIKIVAEHGISAGAEMNAVEVESPVQKNPKVPETPSQMRRRQARARSLALHGVITFHSLMVARRCFLKYCLLDRMARNQLNHPFKALLSIAEISGRKAVRAQMCGWPDHHQMFDRSDELNLGSPCLALLVDLFVKRGYVQLDKSLSFDYDPFALHQLKLEHKSPTSTETSPKSYECNDGTNVDFSSNLEQDQSKLRQVLEDLPQPKSLPIFSTNRTLTPVPANILEYVRNRPPLLTRKSEPRTTPFSATVRLVESLPNEINTNTSSSLWRARLKTKFAPLLIAPIPAPSSDIHDIRRDEGLLKAMTEEPEVEIDLNIDPTTAVFLASIQHAESAAATVIASVVPIALMELSMEENSEVQTQEEEWREIIKADLDFEHAFSDDSFSDAEIKVMQDFEFSARSGKENEGENLILEQGQGSELVAKQNSGAVKSILNYFK